MIHFGTSGWRGIIGDEFTFHNVRLVTQAIVDHLRAASTVGPLVIGYDTRFLSEKFAVEASKVISQNGIPALRCQRDVPTPTVAFAVTHFQAAGALNFTASHNPPEYNGLKFHDATGATALPETTSAIEEHLRRLEPDFDDRYLGDPGLTEIVDPSNAYLEQVAKLVDLEAIGRSGLRIAVDPLYGTGRGYLDRVLVNAGVQCTTVHEFRDPYFGGYSPAASRDNLADLQQQVATASCDLGLATDSDADRFAIVDSDGTWLNPNDILGLLADYLLGDRGLRGDLGRTVATTHLLDRIAAERGVRVRETPVGFKYIGALIRAGEVVFGGEESAGMSTIGHVPEKDGILACLLVAELAAKRGTPLRTQLEALWSRVGRSVHLRRDTRLTPALEAQVGPRLETVPRSLAGRRVRRTTRLDGVKLHFDDAWFMYRRSGTERALRCYSEAPTREQAEEFHDAGRRYLSGTETPEVSDATD